MLGEERRHRPLEAPRASNRSSAPPRAAQSLRASARSSWKSAFRTSTVKPRSSLVTSASPGRLSRPRRRARPARSGRRIRSHSSRRLESTARTIARRKTSISSTSGVFAGAGTRLHERLVRVAQVPEQRPLGAPELVLAHVLVEVHEALDHLAGDRLRAHVVAAHPRVLARERVERLVDELAQRLRVLELLELLDALLVLDAGHLQLGHLRAS